MRNFAKEMSWEIFLFLRKQELFETDFAVLCNIVIKMEMVQKRQMFTV